MGTVWGILIVVAGVLSIIIGFTGSQHRVLDILKNVHSPQSNTAAEAPGGKPTSAGGTVTAV